MKCFPVVVKAYLKNNKIQEAKPGDIFDIVTIEQLGGLHASITYGNSWEVRPALDGETQASRYKALLNLLESTEALLGEMVRGEWVPAMENKTTVPQTGATVDDALLM